MPKKSPYPDLVIPEISFSEFLFSIIEQFGDDIAMMENSTGESLTYEEIYSKSRKLAASLYQMGLRKGDVVAICAPSCVQYAIILLATASCGAALTTCNPDYTVGEILFQFRLAKPVMVFADMSSLDRIKNVEEQLNMIKHIIPFESAAGFESLSKLIEGAREENFPSVEINPKEDVLLMPYSSGTTGLPKCVMQTHKSVVAALTILAARGHIFRSSVHYSERPMYHTGGTFMMLSVLTRGAFLVIEKHFDIQTILQAIEKHKVTYTLFVPPMVVALSNDDKLLTKYDLSSLKVATCFGAAVSSTLLAELGKKMNVLLHQIYGMTECLISSADPVISNPASAGVINNNTEVKVIDLSTGKELGEDESGEILAKGPQTMIGYFENPEATAQAIDEDGWLHTGDIGHYNKDGVIFITGRLKEIIKYRTFQVSPAEIEDVLLSHPKIADAGVIGFLDDEAGEIPRALVVRKDESLTKDEVIKLVENQLSDYKHLRGGVQFVDSIPKSILGKILRQELKKIVQSA